MATEIKKSSPIKYFVIFFIAIFILAISIWFLKRAARGDAQILKQGTFVSNLEERRGKRPDGTEYIYYVINTTNTSNAPYYECKENLIAKGTKETYLGFLEDYTERDCKQIPTVKPQYECRLTNWINRYFRFDKVRSLKKLQAGGKYEIPVSWFYNWQTKRQLSFTANNQLSDIYSVEMYCNASDGHSVTHSQLF